jgi:hypothetical protein
MALWMVLAAGSAPAETPAKDKGEVKTCKAASDCKGMLPHICKDCGGKQQCAHFVCVAGQCKTEICSP